jgi:hypothetical protein
MLQLMRPLLLLRLWSPLLLLLRRHQQLPLMLSQQLRTRMRPVLLLLRLLLSQPRSQGHLLHRLRRLRLLLLLLLLLPLRMSLLLRRSQLPSLLQLLRSQQRRRSQLLRPPLALLLLSRHQQLSPAHRGIRP